MHGGGKAVIYNGFLPEGTIFSLSHSSHPKAKYKDDRYHHHRQITSDIVPQRKNEHLEFKEKCGTV